MKRRIFVSLTIAFFIFVNLPALSFVPPNPAVAQGRGGAVASVDRDATKIGINVLKAGGNAIDAAVATTAALGVTDPFSTGIGGGGFMMIYLKAKNRVITLDGRETAPATANIDLFQDPDRPKGENLTFFPNRISNGAAVGVPGTPLTWSEALRLYGTWQLQAALRPAIDLAQTGFKVDATFAKQIETNQVRFAAFAPTTALYLPHGKPPAVGSTFKNSDLAKTYQMMASQGVEGFYRGKLGQAIVETVQHPPTIAQPSFRVIPGGMTMADLARYQVKSRSPILTNYRGYKIYSMGLPSSGGTTGKEVMNIVSGFNLASLDRVKAWHTIIEAERLAFADRDRFIGDPSYVEVPLTGLLSPEFAKVRRQSIGVGAASRYENRTPGKDFRALPGDPFPFQHGENVKLSQFPPAPKTNQPQDNSTTHLTVIDRFGNIVSYTSTLEQIGGSGIVVPGYGFILNNELTDFDLTPNHPNRPEPGKRPRSSLSPTITFEPSGNITAYGSPGGSTIITTALGIGFNRMDFGMSLADAIAAPRISQRNGGVTQIDGGFEKTDLGKGLIALGHVLEPVPEIGAATGISIAPNGRIIAAAEPVRRGGGSAMTVKR
jgi:gamma-glutamyltranspeptidase / glutathione hydrolase